MSQKRKSIDKKDTFNTSHQLPYHWYRLQFEELLPFLSEIESESIIHWDKDKLQNEFQRSEFYGIVSNGELHAWIALTFLFDGVEIPILYCKKKSRQQGWARLLMEQVIDAMCFDQKIWLEVSTQNESALHLYKSMGFRIQRVRSHYYPGGISAYCMEKVPTREERS